MEIKKTNQKEKFILPGEVWVWSFNSLYIPAVSVAGVFVGISDCSDIEEHSWDRAASRSLTVPMPPPRSIIGRAVAIVFL